MQFFRNLPKDDPLAVVPQLKPVCFGSRRRKGFEMRFHSYLGEAFTGDLGKYGKVFTLPLGYLEHMDN